MDQLVWSLLLMMGEGHELLTIHGRFHGWADFHHRETIAKVVACCILHLVDGGVWGVADAGGDGLLMLLMMMMMDMRWWLMAGRGRLHKPRWRIVGVVTIWRAVCINMRL